MGAAADLKAEGGGIPGAGHADHPHHIPVAVAEKGQRPLLHRISVGSFPRRHRQVGADLPVGQTLRRQQFLGGQRAHMVEIKAQPPRCAQGTRLPHMAAQNGTQGGVQQMRAAVVARRVPPPLGVNLRRYIVPQGNVALVHDAAMDNQAGHRTLRILHQRPPRWGL